MRTVGNIQRIGACSQQEFQQHYVEQDCPVIIEGALSNWPAVSNWDESGLIEKIGSVSTRFKVSPSHRHPDFSERDLAKTFAVQTGTFEQLITKWRQPFPTTAHYLLTGEEEFLIRRRPGKSEERNQKLAALFSDFFLPELFDAKRLYSSWFWMSGAGVRSWLHYDNNGCHNLNAQVQGSKRVWLIAPEQLAKSYPFPLDGTLPAYNCCKVDIEAPQLDQYPLFGELECMVGELSKGDLLFIPANWIHSFLHLGALNVNVNFWWKPQWLRQSPVSLRQAIIDAYADQGGVKALSAELKQQLAALERAILNPCVSESGAYS